MKHKKDWVLWGYHPQLGDEPIPFTGGNLGHCRKEMKDRESLGGYLMFIYREGTSPDGLREQVLALNKNPVFFDEDEIPF